MPWLIGLEATGNCDWFAATEAGARGVDGRCRKIRASYVRRQKNDRGDGQHLLTLLRKGRFPRLWRPTAEQRDVRQLLIHRHQLVEMRARGKTGCSSWPRTGGCRRRAGCGARRESARFASLALPGWAGCRRADLLELLGYLDGKIAPLDRAAEELCQGDQVALLLKTQPGVGPITALAFAVTIGDASLARKLAVRLYWMMRTHTAYPEIVRIESSPRVPRDRSAAAD